LVWNRTLSRNEADRSADPLDVKVVRNKPAGAVDPCYIGEQKVTDKAICRAAFPYFGDPRVAAGGPLADDVMKCQLKPLDRTDYNAIFTDDQWARLRNAFPAGVCDCPITGVPGIRSSIRPRNASRCPASVKMDCSRRSGCSNHDALRLPSGFSSPMALPASATVPFSPGIIAAFLLDP
jgi:hypothetical protein